jgi:hypothetical protein
MNLAENIAQRIGATDAGRCRDNPPLGRVRKMGSTGDPPVPVGDPPTGRAKPLLPRGASLLAPGALPVPPGESPGGTGQWPVLPKTIFRTRSWTHTLLVRINGIRAPALERTQSHGHRRQRLHETLVR